jgi:hypothetical protein
LAAHGETSVSHRALRRLEKMMTWIVLALALAALALWKGLPALLFAMRAVS